MMQQLQYGMNGMPFLGMAGNMNGIYMFTGNYVSLSGRLQTLSDTDINQIRQANIIVTGKQIKEANICCMIWTIVLGSCFIFPIFFMCCNWWKKMVYPAYDIPIQTYELLQNLSRCPKLTILNLNVVDNVFNAQKAQVIHKVLSMSNIRSFTFVNSALNLDYDSKQYSDFHKNMAPIGSLGIATDFRWIANM